MELFMAKTKVQKATILRDLETKLGESKSVVFANFSGLKAAESRELNKQLKAESGECYVAKKTLLAKALENKGLPVFEAKGEGQLAVIFGYGDEVASAKVTSAFVKSTDGRLNFAGGILEGKLLGKNEVTALATMPSKQQLYGMLVRTLNAPVSGFVNTLAGVPRGFVRVLSAIGESKS